MMSAEIVLLTLCAGGCGNGAHSALQLQRPRACAGCKETCQGTIPHFRKCMLNICQAYHSTAILPCKTFISSHVAPQAQRPSSSMPASPKLQRRPPERDSLPPYAPQLLKKAAASSHTPRYELHANASRWAAQLLLICLFILLLRWHRAGLLAV